GPDGSLSFAPGVNSLNPWGEAHRRSPLKSFARTRGCGRRASGRFTRNGLPGVLPAFRSVPGAGHRPWGRVATSRGREVPEPRGDSDWGTPWIYGSRATRAPLRSSPEKIRPSERPCNHRRDHLLLESFWRP